MKGITRRQLSAAGLGMAALSSRAAAAFTHPLGAELYTVRSLMPNAAEQTLQAIAAIGYKEVELDRVTLLRVAPMLEKFGLIPAACHIETPLVTGAWQPWLKMAAQRKTTYADQSVTLAQAIEETGKRGVKYIVIPYLHPEERGDLDSYKRLADKMNHAGAQARAAGLGFCYHNHAFEFEGERGKRPIDILIERLDKKSVALELDVFWVSVSGNDPVEMLKLLKGRVPLVHLKDKAKDAPVLYSEAKVTPPTFKEVGAGSLNFVAILKAAAAAGTKHYFVEQDQTPGDPVASLKQSYQYLRSL
jgi:sugar phosphate isomerase/epimerase